MPKVIEFSFPEQALRLPDDAVVTVRDLRTWLRTSEGTIYNAIKDGRLPEPDAPIRHLVRGRKPSLGWKLGALRKHYRGEANG